jgi:hypothetical protein
MSRQAFCGKTYLFIYLFIYLFGAFCDVVYMFSGNGGRRRIEKIEYWGAS